MPTNIECYDVGIDVHNTDFSSVYDENEMTREISIPAEKIDTELDGKVNTSEIDLSNTKSAEPITITIPVKFSKKDLENKDED